MKAIYIQVNDEIEKMSAMNLYCDSESTMNQLEDIQAVVGNKGEKLLKAKLKEKYEHIKEVYDAIKTGYVLNLQFTKKMNLIVVPCFLTEDPNLLYAFIVSWDKMGVHATKKYFKTFFDNVKIMPFEQIEELENETNQED